MDEFAEVIKKSGYDKKDQASIKPLMLKRGMKMSPVSATVRDISNPPTGASVLNVSFFCWDGPPTQFWKRAL